MNKPKGISSFDVIRGLKPCLDKKQKIGHAGSLDPLATGLLIICLGKGTKISSFVMDQEKDYRMLMKLGERTDTQDADGKIIESAEVPALTEDQLKQCLEQFVGVIDQVPPMYSALKHKGQPLYKLARQGKEVPREARQVHISKIELLSVDLPYVKVDVTCSKGTYLRSLADDIGTALKCGAHVVELERTRIGAFDLEKAADLASLQEMSAEQLESCVLPLDQALHHIEQVSITEAVCQKIRNGWQPKVEDMERWVQRPLEWGEKTAILSKTGQLVAITERPKGWTGGNIKLLRVFV